MNAIQKAMSADDVAEGEFTTEVTMGHDFVLKKRERRKRWEDAKGNIVWPRARIYTFQVVESQRFEMFMGVVIIFNLILIILEVDLEALCYDVPGYMIGDSIEGCDTKDVPWLWITNLLLLLVYTVEAAARLYCERMHALRSHWNKLDFVIVIAGWMSEALKGFPAVSFLRFLRTVRLLRMIRIFISFRELYLLVSGLLSAMKTLFFSTIMLFCLLTLWSIILVEYVHPINAGLDYEDCPRCKRAFKSVMESNLTLFQQIVTGDSWGMTSIPIIEKRPALGIILIGIVISVSLGLMNLILAVIVERAEDAREHDREQALKHKEAEQEEQKMELFFFCQQMDADSSGLLNLAELLDAYENIAAFRHLLSLMDIQKDELQSVFKLLDRDGSGDVSYEEFCEELHKIRTRDTRTMLTFLKLAVTELGEKAVSQDEHKALRKTVDSQMELMTDMAKRVKEMSEGSNRTAAKSSKERAKEVFQRPPHDPQLASALSKEAREIASLKNGIISRVEDQMETLLHHSDWISALGVSQPQSGAPASPKMHRVEEKMGRLQENLCEVEKKFEESAAALARNTELLSGLSKDMDYQPKAGQRRIEGLGQSSGMPQPSPRVGLAPQKLGGSMGDQQLRPGKRGPAHDPGNDPTCRCMAVERPNNSERITQPRSNGADISRLR